MRKGTLLYCVLPAVAGLALIAVAVLLSSASPGGPVVPSVQASDGVCTLQINKQEVDRDQIHFAVSGVTKGTDPLNLGDFDEDAIFYEITVMNTGTQVCEGGGSVVDTIDGGKCVGADVLDFGRSTVISIDGCPAMTQPSSVVGKTEVPENEVIFGGVGSLGAGDSVVLLVVVEPYDRFQCVEDEACLVPLRTDGNLGTGGPAVPSDENNLCAQVVTCGRRHHTPTPTPMPTATPAPTNTPRPPAPTATAKPLATLVPPKTGTGSESGSSPWLPIGLGLGGVCLLLVSGAALAKKRIR